MATGAAKIRGLLQWCKQQVDGYPGVEVGNFTKSFRDGLAFCAIIHRYRPELIDFYALSKENVLENNNLAYSVAEKELGIPPLLDAEDMVAVSVPDRLSVITYVSQYYNCFANKTPMGGPNVVAAEPAKPGGLIPGRTGGQSGRKKETLPDTTSSAAPADVCAICHKSVYMLERQHHNDQLYHRSCLRKSQVKAIGEKVKSLERGAHLKRNLIPPAVAANSSESSVIHEDGVRSSKRRSPSPALTRPTTRQMPANGAVRIQPNSLVGLPTPTPVPTVPAEPATAEMRPKSPEGELETKPNKEEKPASSRVTALTPEVTNNSVPARGPSPKPGGERVGTPEQRRRSRSPPGAVVGRGKSAEPDSLPNASVLRHSARYSHLGDSHFKRRAPAPPPAAQSTPPTARHRPSAAAHRIDSPPPRPPPMVPPPPRIPSIRTMPPPVASAAADVEYPEDLNPFADEDEYETIAPPPMSTTTSTTTTASEQPKPSGATAALPVDVTFEYKGKNPFDMEEEAEETSAARRPSPPALQTLPENAAMEYHGKNPFETDSEEDTSSHDLSSISASSLRQSSHRKKRLAPPPPAKKRPENGHAAASMGDSGSGKPATDSSVMDSESPTNEVSPSSTNSGLVDLPSGDAEGGGKRKIVVTVREESPASGREDTHENPPASVASHLRKIVPPDDLHASSEGEEGSESGTHRKGPAPSLPVVSRRCVRTDADEEFVPYAQLIAELEQLNEEQSQLEKRGQQLEEELRNSEKKVAVTEDNDSESVDIDSAVDALMVSWLELIERKNQLFRRESELHYRIRQRELEERHADIEFELRQLLAKQDNLKTADDKQREDVLLQDLQACVMERSELIFALDEDQQRNIEEDKHRTRVLGPKFSNVLCMSSKLKKKSKEDKKDKKKEKKKKEKEKKKT